MSKERELDEWLDQMNDEMEQDEFLFESKEDNYAKMREDYMDFEDSDGLEAYLCT